MGVVRRRAVGRQVVRVAATTAVVAGTAGAVHHAMNKPAQAPAPAPAQPEQVYYEQAPSQPVYYEEPAAPPAGDDLSAQIQRLAELHNSGVLTDEEFSAAKAKLIAG
jgi:hypothetical protein